jgi:hypothetical protein
LAPILIIGLAVLNLPALFDGGFVDPALERAENPPAAWRQAAESLDAGSAEHRVMQLPGAEFGAFRWGYTVDPPLPGLSAKPLITRDLLPLGSPAAMDLLYALDDRAQANTLDPGAIAPLARLFGADTIFVSNDMAFERFRTPRPELTSALFAARPRGLAAPTPFGQPVANLPVLEMLDETALADASSTRPRRDWSTEARPSSTRPIFAAATVSRMPISSSRPTRTETGPISGAALKMSSASPRPAGPPPTCCNVTQRISGSRCSPTMASSTRPLRR